MARSYKKVFMELLNNGYRKYNIKVNGKDVELYTNHYQDIVSKLDLDTLAIEHKLIGSTKPIAIIQYFTIAPWDNRPIPMIAFVWSWGGPWAFIYNIKYPDYSESGSVPKLRVEQSINV